MGNPGIDLDLQWVESTRINRPMVEKRAAEIPTRRTVKKKWQMAWLLRAIECIDLTTLAGDDTPSNVKRLCAKARHPVQPDILKAIGIDEITTGAVCVYPSRVADAGSHARCADTDRSLARSLSNLSHALARYLSVVAALKGSNIPVASVATGFPAGQTPLETRLQEIRLAVAAYVRSFVRARHDKLTEALSFCISVAQRRLISSSIERVCIREIGARSTTRSRP